jgi:hypothetical protein
VKKTKLIIHAGMPKTATTSIQAHFNHISKKNPRSVIYPSTGRYPGSEAHHEIFYSLVSDRAVVKTPLPDPQPFEILVDDLREEIGREISSRTGGDVVVLSSELLWNPAALPVEKLERLKVALPDFDVSIIVFLREIRSHALSGYAQRVTGVQSYCGSFADHVRESVASRSLDYAGRLQDFQTVFENVSVVWYDDCLKDVLSPFRRLILQPIGELEGLARNKRQSWAQVNIARRINRIVQNGNSPPIVLRLLQNRVLPALCANLRIREALDKAFYPMTDETLSILAQLDKKATTSFPRTDS